MYFLYDVKQHGGCLKCIFSFSFDNQRTTGATNVKLGMQVQSTRTYKVFIKYFIS